MKIVIPDDYQDMVDQLPCFSLIRHHDVTRYREPARDLEQLVERLKDADVVVSIRERVNFSRELLTRLPKLKLIALVGRNSHMLDFNAATELGIPVSTGVSNSPVAPAELTLALIVASRRNVRRRRQGPRHEGADLGPEELAGEGCGCRIRDGEDEGRAVRALGCAVDQRAAAAGDQGPRRAR
jgi:D-3-phosphoglycerate dehydrogenase